MAPDFTTGIWYLERGNVDTGKSYQTHGAGTVGPMPVRQQINPSTYRKEGSIGGQSKFDAVVIEEGVSALGSLCHPCSSGWGGGGCSLLASPSLPRLPSSTARFARTRTAPLCAQPAFNLNCFRLAGTQRERGKAEARAAGVNPFLPLLFGFLAEIDSKPPFKQVYFKTCSKNRCLSRSVEIFLQQMCCNQGFLPRVLEEPSAILQWETPTPSERLSRRHFRRCT